MPDLLPYACGPIMKQKEIIKALRSKADQELLKFQFKFNTKLDGYIKFDPESKLYFEITFAYMDYASAKNNHG
jgi:hypothetical protein